MLGEKLKELREANNLLQRQLAEVLQIDTAYVSKMEKSEKPVSRHYLKTLSHLFCISEDELNTLWLADKVYDIVKDERMAGEALKSVNTRIKKKK